LPDLFGEGAVDEEVHDVFIFFFAKGTPSRSFDASFPHVVPSGGFFIEYTPHEYFFFWGTLYFPKSSPPPGWFSLL